MHNLEGKLSRSKTMVIAIEGQFQRKRGEANCTQLELLWELSKAFQATYEVGFEEYKALVKQILPSINTDLLQVPIPSLEKALAYHHTESRKGGPS